jgi:hypothetical protein
MSGAGGSFSAGAVLSLKNSQLGKALNGGISLTGHKGYSAVTPMYEDDSILQPQANGVFNPAFSSTLRYNLTKNSTLISRCWVEITLAAGADTSGQNGGVGFNPNIAIGVGNQPFAEYNKNAGDLIVDRHVMIYGNTQLQNNDGRFIALFRRVCKNDVNIEATNAMVLGNLQPGGGGELVLIDAYYRGVTLEVPLEELHFVNNLDESWMPEAYALEAQLALTLANLGQIVSTRNRTAADVGAVGPVITSNQLRYQELTVSAAEKEQRLKFYRTPEGVVTHFLDIEEQLNSLFTGTGLRPAWAPLPGGFATQLANQPVFTPADFTLGNIRMDMGEVLFCVHRTAQLNLASGNNYLGPAAVAGQPVNFPLEQGVITDAGFGGSYLEGDTTPSLLMVGLVAPRDVNEGFSTLIDITSYDFRGAGKSFFSAPISGVWNRTAIRKTYHPDAQIVGAIYVIPFARYPEDRRNATGFISAAVSGNLTFRITLPNPGNGVTYRFDAYVHSHNLLQARGGSIAKAYN